MCSHNLTVVGLLDKKKTAPMHLLGYGWWWSPVMWWPMKSIGDIHNLFMVYGIAAVSQYQLHVLHLLSYRTCIFNGTRNPWYTSWALISTWNTAFVGHHYYCLIVCCTMYDPVSLSVHISNRPFLCNSGMDGCSAKVDVLGEYLHWRWYPSPAAWRSKEVWRYWQDFQKGKLYYNVVHCYMLWLWACT